MPEPVALVTGGSSGIGRETARFLREAGCTVYECSRRDIPAEGVIHLRCDVSSEADAALAVEEVISREGRLDILVNNAGFGISGAAELTEGAEARALLDVNLFGAVNMIRAAVPHMRAAGGGRIVNLSSVAAVMPLPFQTWYSVSKAAVNCYTMALANELRPFGISVCAVMPGDIKSGFTDARCKREEGDVLYSGRISRSVGAMERDERSGMSPSAAGRFIARAALRRRSRPLLTLGFTYKLVTFLGKLLPAALVNRILYRMYAR